LLARCSESLTLFAMSAETGRICVFAYPVL
jgi:hypothetical protein